MKSIIIGISGGTASGKTTLAERLHAEAVKYGDCAHIRFDDYYFDYDEIPLDENGKKNFDHPNAFDIELAYKQLKDLKNGLSIDKPIHDYITSTRKKETERIEPVRLVIVEGIIIFSVKKLRSLFDIKLFVDTPDDIRIIRRIKRDMIERERSLESIITQYLSSVRPMHEAFVEPSKKYADIIIPDGGHNEVALDFLFTKIQDIYKK